MRSQGARRGATETVLSPEQLEAFWPDARERVVAALCSQGIEEAVAEDAVAEAATRALSRGLLVADVDDFCRWAFVVARNVALDEGRHARRMLLVDAIPDRPAEYDLPRHVEARETWRAATEAMGRLSVLDRSALLTELDPAQRTTRKEAVKHAVRRHRARARLRQALGQLGGWLGWLRRPPWPWPVVPTTSWDGWVAAALLPFLAAGLSSASGPGADGANRGLALPAWEAEPQAPASSSAAPSAPHVVAPHTNVAAAPSAADPAVPVAPDDEGRFEFTPSPSYADDHTLYAEGTKPCGPLGVCPQLYVSRDSGETWALLPAEGRPHGRILLPPSYPRDPRIFSASSRELSVSTDGGLTFRRLTPLTGPVAMSPLFSAGDPRFVVASYNWQRTPVMQYRDGDTVAMPFPLPLPANAAALQLWFADSYAEDGRMFVYAIESPDVLDLVDDGKPTVDVSIPTMYTCDREQCTRVIDFGLGLVPPRVVQSTSAPNTVFVGSTFRIHRSTDNGSSFQALPLPGTGGADMLAGLLAAPGGRLYAEVLERGMRRGLYASDDDGNSWLFVREMPDSIAVLAVLPDGTLMEGAPTAGGAGVRCSADGGHTWSQPCRR